MPEVKLASEYGFCYGVERALEIVEKMRKKGVEFDTLGPIIHNPQVVAELEKKGIKAVERIYDTPKPYILIRTHGVPPNVYKEAEKLGKKIIDATCPFVANAQKMARKFQDEGYLVVVVGKQHHPEVKGIVGNTNGKAIVVGSGEEAKKVDVRGKKVGVVAQTTVRLDLVQEVISEFLEDAKEVRFANTRCNTTQKRQDETREMAKEVDVMVIVGGKNSSNTRRLYEIAAKNCKKAYHIEKKDELRKEWFYNIDKVGVTGGASTPPEIVREVYEEIKKILFKGGTYGGEKGDGE